MDRGTGETTRQMKQAPRGALFIWCNAHLWYARDLARHLGRDDLLIERPSILDMGARALYGRRLPAIVVDHAARFTPDQRRGFDVARQLVAA